MNGTSKLGASLDLFDFENPVIVLRLSERDAENLRAFLQQHDVGETSGSEKDVYRPVYREILNAQKRLGENLDRKATDIESAVKTTAEYVQNLRRRAAAYDFRRRAADYGRP